MLLTHILYKLTSHGLRGKVQITTIVIISVLRKINKSFIWSWENIERQIVSGTGVWSLIRYPTLFASVFLCHDLFSYFKYIVFVIIFYLNWYKVEVNWNFVVVRSFAKRETLLWYIFNATYDWAHIFEKLLLCKTKHYRKCFAKINILRLLKKRDSRNLFFKEQ